jgi:hypothetical protein
MFFGYKEGTGFPPSPWWEGEVREVAEVDAKYSIVLHEKDVVLERADAKGPDPSYALSIETLYRLVRAAEAAGILSCQPFPPAPGAYVSGGRWILPASETLKRCYPDD